MSRVSTTPPGLVKMSTLTTVIGPSKLRKKSTRSRQKRQSWGSSGWFAISFSFDRVLPLQIKGLFFDLRAWEAGSGLWSRRCVSSKLRRSVQTHWRDLSRSSYGWEVHCSCWRFAFLGQHLGPFVSILGDINRWWTEVFAAQGKQWYLHEELWNRSAAQATGTCWLPTPGPGCRWFLPEIRLYYMFSIAFYLYFFKRWVRLDNLY